MRYLLLALMLVSVTANSQQDSLLTRERNHSKQQAKEAKQNGKDDQRGSDRSPLFIKVVPTPEGESQAAEDAKEKKEKAELDRKLVDFNGELAYYTKALAWLAFFQFLALGAQVIFLSLAFKESRKGTNIARYAMIAGERAFVFVKVITWGFSTHPITGQYSYSFQPTWENSGDTPTRRMKTFVDWPLRQTPMPRNFDWNVAIGMPGLIAPKSTMGGATGPHPGGISAADMLAVQSGTKFLYILGWAKYCDVFPESPEHQTRFCYQITVNGNPLNPDPKFGGGISFNFNLHGWGNCSDEECTEEDRAKDV